MQECKACPQLREHVYHKGGSRRIFFCFECVELLLSFDTFDILYLDYSNFCKKKKTKIQWYQKLKKKSHSNKKYPQPY